MRERSVDAFQRWHPIRQFNFRFSVARRVERLHPDARNQWKAAVNVQRPLEASKEFFLEAAQFGHLFANQFDGRLGVAYVTLPITKCSLGDGGKERKVATNGHQPCKV